MLSSEEPGRGRRREKGEEEEKDEGKNDTWQFLVVNFKIIKGVTSKEMKGSFWFIYF